MDVLAVVRAVRRGRSRRQLSPFVEDPDRHAPAVDLNQDVGRRAGVGPDGPDGADCRSTCDGRSTSASACSSHVVVCVAARNSLDPSTHSCTGIVVGTPSTRNSESARSIRVRARSRSSADTISFANMES